MRRTSALLLLPAALAAAGAHAQSEPSHDIVRSPILESMGQDASAGRNVRIEWLHETRDYLRDFLEGVGRTVDGWFGDVPPEPTQRLVNGRLSLNTLWRRDEGLQTGLNFRGKFNLPNLKNKAYLYFGQDNERDLVTDQPEEFSRRQRLLAEQDDRDKTFFAGLGYALRENIDLRGGIRGPLRPFVQARFVKKWYPGDSDEIEFRETLFWEGKEGFGLTTALNYQYGFTRDLEFRWRNSVTLSESTDALAWQSSAGFYLRLGGPRQLSIEALINGETGHTLPVDEYGVRGIYRRAIYEDWLLGEFIVGHFWPRDENDPEREKSWAAGIGVEMLF